MICGYLETKFRGIEEFTNLNMNGMFPNKSSVSGIHRRGHAVAQLVETLRKKPEGREFDSRSGHWNFFH